MCTVSVLRRKKKKDRMIAKVDEGRRWEEELSVFIGWGAEAGRKYEVPEREKMPPEHRGSVKPGMGGGGAGSQGRRRGGQR